MNTTDQNVQLKTKLQEIAEYEPNTLRASVAQAALEYGSDEIVDFFRDLSQHGCISGMVTMLIYYVDTHAFYDRHYDEIEELRIDMEENLGEPLRVNGDLKNWMAWFAFEETAYRMAIDELEIDL